MERRRLILIIPAGQTHQPPSRLSWKLPRRRDLDPLHARNSSLLRNCCVMLLTRKPLKILPPRRRLSRTRGAYDNTPRLTILPYRSADSERLWLHDRFVNPWKNRVFKRDEMKWKETLITSVATRRTLMILLLRSALEISLSHRLHYRECRHLSDNTPNIFSQIGPLYSNTV